MNQTRNYRDDEMPQLGDVIQVYDGSFGTAVIAAISDVPCEQTEYTLYRPHVEFKSGVLVPATEVLKVWIGGMRKMKVYVTGASGKVENRNY